MKTELQNPRNNTNFSIAPDQFEKVIANLHSEQQDTLRWWYFMGKEQQWSLGKLAKASGVHTSTLSKVFRGVYGADLDDVCETLAKARANFNESVDNPDFVPTSLSKRIFRACDRSRALVTVAIMWGEMGIGKTCVCEEYRRQNNHGRTGYVRCGSAMTFAAFVSHVARCIGIASANQNQFLLREKIISVMAAGQRLLIVDEFHQIFLTTRGDTAVRIAEFLREIYDRAQCGLVLIGTEVVQHEFFKGQHREALGQLVDRGPIQIPLPSKPTRQDIALFFRRFSLPVPDEKHPEAAELLRDILAAHGLRKLTLHLRNGKAFSARVNETYTLNHFVQAYEDLASLSRVA